jgi:hypothetical protein
MLSLLERRALSAPLRRDGNTITVTIDYSAIRAYHREMHEKFRMIGTGTIEYLGMEFALHRNVFWPGDDSVPLVKNDVVNPGEEALDLCTGAGHIAVFSASKGARSVCRARRGTRTSMCIGSSSHTRRITSSPAEEAISHRPISVWWTR